MYKQNISSVDLTNFVSLIPKNRVENKFFTLEYSLRSEFYFAKTKSIDTV